MSDTVGLALLGAGIFAKDAYVRVLRDLTSLFDLKFVWSKSQSSAEKLVALVKPWSPSTIPLWGDDGLQRIFNESPDVSSCAIVLPIQLQPAMVKRALTAGKHVIQEKPIAPTVQQGLDSASFYSSLAAVHRPPVWAVAENFRFEPALERGAELIASLGRMSVFQVDVEMALDSRNKYFSCDWRRDPNFTGAFVTDTGVHFVAALRALTGQDVTSVMAFTSHRDEALPPPDNMAAALTLANGCSGTMAISFSSPVNKMTWRVVCADGALDVERGPFNGQFGFKLVLTPRHGGKSEEFIPCGGVEEELRAFYADVIRWRNEDGLFEVEKKGAPLEALKDLATIEAAVRSGLEGRGIVDVHSFEN